MSAVRSHAGGGCWAAPAAPAMLHRCAVLAVGAAATALGQGLFCDAFQGGGHQPGGARRVLPAPASADGCAEPDLCRALC